MNNVHTCGVCRPDLIDVVIGLMHGELFKLTSSDVVCVTRV
jgi:hypothetical protein